MNLYQMARNCALATLIFAACEAAATEARVVEVQFAGGRVEGKPKTIRVVRGEEIALRVGSDEKLAVHVHGYGIETPVKPGTSVTIPIRATLVGRFSVTAHLSGTNSSGARPTEPVLLYLEVHPE